MYRALRTVLAEYNVPLTKVIGLCSDGASTMRGVYRGVCTRLAQYIRELRDVALHEILGDNRTRTLDSFHPQRGIFSVHCVCHRLALVVTDAFKGSNSCEQVVPDECLELLTSLFSYFAKSVKRKKKLRAFLSEVNNGIRRNRGGRDGNGNENDENRNPNEALERVLSQLEEQHKLPRRLVLTRWLSSAEAIKVVTTSRETYKNFFAEETTEHGREIYDLLYDDVVFGWYYCLLDVLPVLTSMNVLFQSRLPLPHLLYPRIRAAKSTLINMVGVGAVRTELIDAVLVDKDTKFGAFANKYLEQHGWTFTEVEMKDIKQAWHKLYTHCLADIDRRFPPETMEMFRLFQVLDPSVVHGPILRNYIGRTDLASAVSELLWHFEIPLHLSLSGKYSTEEIKNSFTAFRTSEVCEDLWKVQTAHNARGHSVDYAIVYTYYRWVPGQCTAIAVQQYN